MRQHPRTVSLLALAATCSCAVADDGIWGFPDYEESFQHPTWNQLATFHVEGPATGDGPDVQGDAFLSSVEYRSGDKFHWYYRPVAIHDLSYSGDPSRWSVRAGTNTTNTNLTGNYPVGALDGNVGDVSPADLSAFRPLVLQALMSNNLNAYVDNSDSSSVFQFTMEFNMPVKDNDPARDDLGEILLFERGSGSGNSWFKLQAVDAGGSPLGPWLVIGPAETLQTSPQTTVLQSNQTMGTVAVDVSRLGVTEFQYLRISNDVSAMDEYTGGGDLAPDFKVMVVVTNEDHLKLYRGAFD